MNSEREGWHKHAAAGDLSERQREVVQLIAAGKTNSEIAEQLGITLDGAKYHVRHVCNRIGVDTREEVAEWWRQQRGMRARFAVTARWSRMPALLKWGLGGAAAAGVAVVAVVMLGLATGSDDGDEGLAQGVWVAVAERESEEVVQPNGETRLEYGLLQIAVMRHDGSQRRAIGEPAEWAQLALSPNGEWLYALGLDEDGRMSVVLFGLAGQDDIRHEMEFEDAPQGVPRWSPDSTRVAVVGNHELSVFDIEGSLRRSVTAPVQQNPTLNTAHWSADSGRFAAISFTRLSLYSPDGEAESEFDLTGPWFESIPFDREVAESAFFSGVEWDGADILYAFVTTSTGNGELWRIIGSHNGATVDWGQPEMISADEHPYWRQSQEIETIRDQIAGAARVDTCRQCPLEAQQGVVVTHAPRGLEPRDWRDSDEVRMSLQVRVNGEWAEVPFDIDVRRWVPGFFVWDVLTIR